MMENHAQQQEPVSKVIIPHKHKREKAVSASNLHHHQGPLKKKLSQTHHFISAIIRMQKEEGGGCGGGANKRKASHIAEDTTTDETEERSNTTKRLKKYPTVTKLIIKSKKSKLSRPLRKNRPKKASRPRPPPADGNLKDVWKAAFLVGTRGNELDTVYNKFNWDVNFDFSNLHDIINLTNPNIINNSNNNLYVFVQLDPVSLSDPSPVPVVVAVTSPRPPSLQIAITSIQGAEEQIVPMEQLHMGWIPYVYNVKDDQIKVSVLGFDQSRAALMADRQHMLLERLEYCLPYVFNPEKERADLEKHNSSEVSIMFPQEPNPPVVCTFDWEMDKLGDLANELVEHEALSADHKDAFKEFVREQVRGAKRKQEEDINRVISEEARENFAKMRFYKLYPQQTGGVPPFQRSSWINRYYGRAHEVH